MSRLKSQDSKIDKPLFFLVFCLTAFGILMIFEASSVMAQESFGDKFFLARSQLVWWLVGILAMIITSKINYHFWARISFFLFSSCLFFLFLVLIPGLGIELLGGRRWLSLAGFRFQPAELTKLTVVIYLASFFQKKRGLLHFLGIISLLTVLLILEPDLGTAVIIIGSSFLVYFLSGANILEVLMVVILGFIAGLGLILSSPYRLSRLKVFLNPNLDPQGSSYHLRQILLSLSAGGWWGRGLGQSRQKFLFLPEAATDSIFAVIAEEVGFIGSLAVLSFFIIFIFRGFKIAKEAPDKVGQTIAAGLTGLIFMQSFINLSAMVSLVPLTGVPLPFISYGGSSLLTNLVATGILLNISRNRLKTNK